MRGTVFSGRQIAIVSTRRGPPAARGWLGRSECGPMAKSPIGVESRLRTRDVLRSRPLERPVPHIHALHGARARRAPRSDQERSDSSDRNVPQLRLAKTYTQTTPPGHALAPWREVLAKPRGSCLVVLALGTKLMTVGVTGCVPLSLRPNGNRREESGRAPLCCLAAPRF